MLSKKVDWSMLAQCDSFAVEKLIETPDRKAMSSVEPMRAPLFARKIERDVVWKNTYVTICDAYNNLKPDFSICHDKYGGYRLLYSGKSVIQPPFVFRRNPLGFLRPIPEGVVTNLSVMSSERTGEQLLLLGPLRFVNSDCNPNCEYNYSSDLGIVQLRVKRKIKPGDELFVKYGAEFFEFNCCLCRTCEMRSKQEEREELAFTILLDEISRDFCQKMFLDLHEQLETKPPGRKRRRIRGRELVEQFNELTNSPLSCDESPENIPTQYPNVASYQRAEEKQNVFGDQDISSSLSSSSSGSCPRVDTPPVISQNDNELSSNIDDFKFASISNQKVIRVFRASSPLQQQVSLSCSMSSIAAEHSLPTFVENRKHDTCLERLFPGSKTSVEDASLLTELFCSKFSLSDECSSNLYSLIKVLLPEENQFPSSFARIRNAKASFENSVRVLQKTEDRTICVMRYRFQLADIFKRSLYQVLKYSEKRRENPEKDFNPNFFPIAEIGRNNTCAINLVFFTDGVSIKKSTYKKVVWPVWVQIGDLPPKLRSARKNIVLAALVISATSPSWNDVVPDLKSEILSGFNIEMDEMVSYKLEFKARLLIADLGAKNHILNMMKFNGYYGCHYCTAKGTTIGSTHAYYPFEVDGVTREPSVNEAYVDTAETLSYRKQTNVVGVKGKSAFAELIEGLPLTAPIDYMHCVLLGVFPDVLRLCYQSLSSSEKLQLSSSINNLSCPREMISYSRKIRWLDEMAQFKANEMFNWLFYLSPIVFLNRLTGSLYTHLTNLVFGVRLLLESSSEENIAQAKFFLDAFCQEIVSMHGDNERMETINVHCLKHLPDQVRRFGPLHCQSAMCFESANRALGEVFSGSTHECEIICRRILQRHLLSIADMDDERLCPLFAKLSGRSDRDPRS